VRKRSKYRPKPIITDPLNWVLNGFKTLEETELTRLGVMHHQALHAMTHGTGVWEDWNTICHMTNLAVALSQMVFGNAYLDDLKEAMVAHARCGRRHLDGKSLAYTGPELQAINTAAEIITEQLRLATRAELEEAVARWSDASEPRTFMPRSFKDTVCMR